MSTQILFCTIIFTKQLEVKRAKARLKARTEPSRALGSAQLSSPNLISEKAQLSSARQIEVASSARFFELTSRAERLSSSGSFYIRFWRIYYRNLSFKTEYLWDQMDFWIPWNMIRLSLKIIFQGYIFAWIKSQALPWGWMIEFNLSLISFVSKQ